jgi:hypothetical protein
VERDHEVRIVLTVQTALHPQGAHLRLFRGKKEGEGEGVEDLQV